ncbi:MAG: hypothetical protein HY645_10655 [Acidobacteria bacterium]|nr:hypothetical protein [Acidobacteriota bacterium]
MNCDEVVIGCALDREISILRKHLRVDCKFLVTGMGATRTQKRLFEYFRLARPALLVFTGTAGQLDPALQMGSVIFPEAWCLQDGSHVSCDLQLVDRLKQRGWKISGLGLTVNSPVVRRQARMDLHQRYSALVCDMEAAFALRMAAEEGIPCLALKVISDTQQAALVAYWTHFEANMARLSEYLNRLLPDLVE